MATQSPNVRAIFERALELASDADRQAYLDESCADRPDVRGKVQALLKAHADAGSFLEEPVLGPERTQSADPIAEQPGTIIGPYKLLEQIGEGGFGVVFMAEQERPVRRRVAVKVIKPGMDSKQVIARFEAERQALALMDHPNIAKVLEAGATESHRPYFVMELVRGISITEFCDQNCLTVDERLELFMTVCHAVQHAHQKGIIHRDIKPTNVLVTLHDGQPVAKVIDFGVAKATGQRLTDKTLFTGFAQMIGTPLYMSPEQAEMSGLDVDTRSDIYSLGVLLYELLTGTTPFDKARMHEANYDEMRRIIREEEPPKPSTRISTLGASATVISNQRKSEPDKLRRLVRGELDWIVMKSLEKDRNRRYETANSLARDLQRYLSDEPVQACPPAAGYRLRKLLRRNRGPVAAAALLFLALVGGMIGTTLGLFEARRVRLESEHNLYVAEIQVASQELEDHNLVGARERLERIARSPSQRELRGWEWRYFMGQCRSDELTPTLGRHESPVWDLAISPDDQWVATISDDGVVKLWDIAGRWFEKGSGTVVRSTLRAVPATVPDPFSNHRSEAKSWQAHVKLADQKLGFLPNCSIAFSSDGQLIATGGADGDVCLWNVLSLERTTLPERLGSQCTGMAFSNDGRLLAALSFEGKVNLWTMSDRAAELSGTWGTDFEYLTRGLAFSRDGRSLAASAITKTTSLWSTSAPDFGKLGDFPGSTAPAVISPDGRSLVAAVLGQHGLKKWSLETFREDKSWRGREAGIERLAFSPDGRLLAAGFEDGTIMLWDMAGEREPRTLMGHEAAVTGLAFLRNKPLLASASADQTVRLWDASMPDHRQPAMRHGSSVLGVSFSPDSRYLASVARESTDVAGKSLAGQHTLKLWEVSVGTEIAHALVGGTSPTADVAFAPDGRFVAADDWADILRVFTVPDLREVTTPLAGHCARFPPDGRTVIYASGSRIVRRGLPVAPENGESTVGQSTGKIIRLALSPDGSTVAAMSDEDDGLTIHLWDARVSRYLRPLVGHVQQVRRLAFSPDGRTLASAGWDGKLGLWDVRDRRKSEMLRGHYGRLSGVTFSPDGGTMATCGDDAIRLWNLASRQQVAVLRTYAQTEDVVFSPDGSWLAAAIYDGTIRLWHAPSFEELEPAEKRPAAE